MHIRTRRFFSYYRPYLGLALADIGCAIVVALIALALPLCVRHITKDILEGGMDGAVRRIVSVGGVMLALALLQAACRFFFDYRGHAMGAMMERDMRAELFAQYQRLSFGFFDREKTGKLLSRITTDLLSLAELYHHFPENVAVDGVKFIGSIAILLAVNWKLALCVFAFLPLMALYTLVLNRRMRAAFADSYARVGDVNARVEESLSGIRVTQSFANEALEVEKFAAENNRFLTSRKTIYRNEAYIDIGVTLFSELIPAAVIVFGGMAIVGGSIDLADVITFLLYVGYFIDPIRRLVFMTEQFQQGVAGFNRLMDILDLVPEVRDAENAAPLLRVEGHVSFRDVSFRYGEEARNVFSGVTLDVRAGETVALVGLSGVGKTTMCSLIPRFYDATGGQVLLDGQDVRDVTLASLRRSVGVVQQDVYLFSGTVMDNIRYGNPEASDEAVYAAAEKANAHAFILAMPDGYQTEVGQRGVRLSGGQKQRISIARVFLKNPPVLIFDEATSALDNESERVIQDSMESLRKDRTTFIIAHRLSTVRSAERIVVLSDHGIAEEGTHEALLLQGGVYARLCAMQFMA